jgi:hypothetical protein
MVSSSHLKWRFFATPQDNIKPVTQRSAWLGHVVSKFGNQSLPGLLIRDSVEYGVKRYQWITGKIHLSNKTRHKRLAKK